MLSVALLTDQARLLGHMKIPGLIFWNLTNVSTSSRSSSTTIFKSHWTFLVSIKMRTSQISRLLTINSVGMKGKFDRIICDPPFLSTDCQTKGKHCFKYENFKQLKLHSCNHYSLAFQNRSSRIWWGYAHYFVHRGANGGTDSQATPRDSYYNFWT